MQNHEQLPDTQAKKPCWKVALQNWLKENSRYLIIAVAAIICCIILGRSFCAGCRILHPVNYINLD